MGRDELPSAEAGKLVSAIRDELSAILAAVHPMLDDLAPPLGLEGRFEMSRRIVELAGEVIVVASGSPADRLVDRRPLARQVAGSQVSLSGRGSMSATSTYEHIRTCAAELCEERHIRPTGDPEAIRGWITELITQLQAEPHGGRAETLASPDQMVDRIWRALREHGPLRISSVASM